jgi:hypothetical protein
MSSDDGISLNHQRNTISTETKAIWPNTTSTDKTNTLSRPCPCGVDKVYIEPISEHHQGHRRSWTSTDILRKHGSETVNVQTSPGNGVGGQTIDVGSITDTGTNGLGTVSTR